MWINNIGIIKFALGTLGMMLVGIITIRLLYPQLAKNRKSRLLEEYLDKDEDTDHVPFYVYLIVICIILLLNIALYIL